MSELNHPKADVTFGRRVSKPAALPSLSLQSSPAKTETKSECSCGGGCPRCQGEPLLGNIQTKLEMSKPGDAHEQEADRVADRVMRTPEPGPTATPKSSADRAPTDLLSGGNPLPESVRTFFEPRFGVDFSQVRVHADEQATQSARALEARAYTLGQHIVFGKAQFAPGSREGQHLLAHELAHVVQQRQAGGPRLLQRAAVQYVEQVSDSDAAAADILTKFDQAVAAIEQNLKSQSGTQMTDLNAALARLKALRKAGNVAVWRMVTSPPVFAAWHNSSGQIRLNLSYPTESTSLNTLMHEATHAVHASRFSGIAEAYGKGTTSGVPNNDPALLLLLYKWKAWTEYWAYRRAAEFSAPQQLATNPQMGHDSAIKNKEIVTYVATVHSNGDPDFDPSKWQPTEADKQKAAAFVGKSTKP